MRHEIKTYRNRDISKKIRMLLVSWGCSFSIFIFSFKSGHFVSYYFSLFGLFVLAGNFICFPRVTSTASRSVGPPASTTRTTVTVSFSSSREDMQSHRPLGAAADGDDEEEGLSGAAWVGDPARVGLLAGKGGRPAAEGENGKATEQAEYRSTPWRWWVLFVFSFASFMQSLVWFTFSSVPKVVEAYYPGAHALASLV